MPKIDRNSSDFREESRSRRILLVDDNSSVRRGLSRFLQLHGFEIVEASDGASALLLLEAGDPFPILLTDLRLPDVEGLEIARKARKLSASIWIGLITGWDVEADDPAFDLVDAVLLKPIDTADLVSRLQSLAPQSLGLPVRSKI